MELDGTDVTANQVITRADIDANKLVFTPATGATGTPYATFGFSVNDGTADSASSYTMSLVVRVPPVLSITASSASVVEGNPVAFTITTNSVRNVARTVHYNVADASGSGRYVASTNEGNKSVVLPANAQRVIVNVPTVDDSTDEVNALVVITLLPDTATPATYTLPSALVASRTVTDDDATTVTLATSDVAATEEDSDETAEFSLTLGRTLASRETIAVPLLFSGGVLGTDFNVSIKGNVPRGVSLFTRGPTATMNFASGARTVTVLLRALADADAVDDTVTVSIPAASSGAAPILTVHADVGSATGSRTGNGQITVTDDDEQGLILSESTLDMTEESSETYTVKLASEPTATVTVTVGGTDLEEVTVDTNSVTSGNQATLEFTAANWNTAQTVTVTAGDDALDSNYTATLTHTAAGGDYATTTKDLTVNVEDNDIPLVSLSLSGETIAEGGSAITVTATLSRNNTSGAALTIPIAVKATDTTAGTSDYTLATSISIANNSSAGTTNFTAAADSTDEPSETVVIELGTLPEGTEEGAPSEVTVTITDADPTVASLARVGTGDVTEGGTIEFTVSLNRTLTGSEIVDVPLEIGGTGVTTDDWTLALKTGTTTTGLTLSDATTTTPNIRFTGVTSAVGEATFTLTTTDDDISETGAKETFQIALGPDGSGANGFDASSLGTNVGGGADPSGTSKSFNVVVNDPALPVVSIAATAATSVVEGNALEFTITIDSARKTARTVHYSIFESGSFIASTNKGTKSIELPANAETVTVSVPTEDDSTDEAAANVFAALLADTATSATYTVSSDPSQASTQRTITDNDATTVTLSTPDATATEEDSDEKAELVLTLGRRLKGSERIDVPLIFGGGTLDVDFSISLETPVPSGVELDESIVTITGNNVDTVTVLLSALADDDAVDNTVTVRIPATTTGVSHVLTVNTALGSATGSRTGNGQITVTDDDEPGLILSESTLDVTEESSSTYTVALATEPYSAVTVTIGGTDLKEVTVDTNSVTSGNQNTLEFTTSNWATAQTVTVAAGDDAITGNYTATLTHTASGGDYVTVTQDLTVTVEDNDIPTVSLSLSSETIQEGGSAITVTATRARSNDSGAPLVIPIAVKTVGTTADAADYTLATSISIPDSATIGTTTFTAATDSSDESSETVIIELGTPPDGTIKGTDSEVTVTITDANPTVASLVRVGTGDVTEGTAIEFTVSLNRTLTGSEIVDVPLSIGGTGVTTADWSLALKSGSASTGLTLSDATTTTPNIRFTGVTSAVDEATFTLTTTDDDIAETGTKETFQIALGSNGSGANGFDASSLGTNVGGGADPSASQNSFNVVVNDPALPVLSIAPTSRATVVEGNAGEFTITSDAARKTARTVHYNVFDFGSFITSANEGNKTVVLPAGDTSVTVSVPTVNDSTDEPIGNMIVTLLDDTATPATYTVNSDHDTASRTMTDDDATTVTLTTPDATATEEDSAATAELLLTLGRHLASGESIAVPLIFSGGTLGTDFSVSLKTPVPDGVTLSESTGVVTFTRNNRTASVLLSALADADAVDDTVTVSIPATSTGATPILTANAAVGSATGSGTGEITVTDDDEPALTLSPSTLSVTEGASSTYTVALATKPSGNVTVTVGGASGDVDFDTNTVTSGRQTTLAFTPTNWATAQTVTVSAEEDGDTTNDTATLTHTASGGDYDAVTKDLSVTVVDNDLPTVSLSLSSETVAEGTAITVTATRTQSNTSGSALTIPISVKATGTTAATADYTLASTNLTIANNSATGTVRFTAATDSSDESSETVIIELGTPPAGTGKGAPSEVTVTITDTNPTVASLARVGTGDVTEGGTIEFTVSLSRTLTGSEIVDVPLSIGGTGVTPADWSLALKSGSATTGLTLSGATTLTPKVQFTGVPSAVDEATFTLTTTDDDIAETGTKETFQIALGPDGSGANGFDASSLATNVGGGVNPSATASQNSFEVVVNDPALPILTIAPTSAASVVEGNAVEFTITSHSARKTARTVRYLVPDISFVAASDQGVETVELPANATSVTVSVPTVSDSIDEANSDMTVNLLGPGTLLGTYTLGSPSTATRRVTDDDATTVTLSTPDATATEASSTATAELLLTLGRTLVASETIAVPLGFSGGTLGTDVSVSLKTPVPSGVTLSESTGVVTFASGARTASVLLRALADDDALEDTVTVSIPATSTGAAPILTVSSALGSATGSGTGEITVTDDDEPALILSAATLNVTEESSATYTVALATIPTADVTVTVGGTSLGEVTFDTDSDTLGTQRTALAFTTSNWNTPQTVTVLAAADTDLVNDTATLTHTAAGGDYAAITKDLPVTVVDNDLPAIALASATATVAEEAGSMTVVFTKSGLDTGADISASWKTVDGTATAGNDFTAATGTVTFSATELSKTIRITLLDDTLTEGSEAFSIVLENPVEATLGVSTQTVTITDDEVPGLRLIPTSLSLTEGERGSYDVQLQTQPSGPVTVTIASDESAVTIDTHPVTDALDSELVFTSANWNQSQPVRVITVEDSDSLDLTATLSHTSTGGGYDGLSRDLTVTVSDPTRPVLTITGVPVARNNDTAFDAVFTFDSTVTPALDGTLVKVDGGTLSAFTTVQAGLEWRVTVTPTAAIDVRLWLPLDSVANVGENGNALTEVTSVYDVAPPAVTVAVPETVSGPFEARFEFTEPVSGLTEADVLVTNGRVEPGSFMLDASVASSEETPVLVGQHMPPTVLVGQNFSCRVIPDGTGPVTVSLRAGSARDLGGNIHTPPPPSTPAPYVPPFLVLSAPELTVAPGSTSSYAVSLSAEPLTTVTVTMTVPSGPIILEDVSLEFSPTNWKSPQTVRVTALDDPDVPDDPIEVIHKTDVGPYEDAVLQVRIVNDLFSRVQSAFLPRFGRMVGQQSVDAITSRLKQLGKTPGVKGRFAGHALPTSSDGTQVPQLSGTDVVSTKSLESSLSPGLERTSALTESALFAESDFSLSHGREDGSALSLWGRGAYDQESSKDAGVSLETTVRSVQMGADWSREGHLAGLMVSRSVGRGDYKVSGLSSDGKIESTLTSLVPYLGWTGARHSFWSAFGVGEGDLVLTGSDSKRVSSNTNWQMVSGGSRGALGDWSQFGGADVSWETDLLWTRMRSEGGRDLPGSTGESSRVRIGLESQWSEVSLFGGQGNPRLELGGRYDGGDGESGLALDAGAGFDWRDASGILELEVSGRTLLLSEMSDVEDWGLSFSFSYARDRSRALGWRAELSQAFGGTSSGGVAALFATDLFPELTSSNESRKWTAELSYGSARGRNRIGAPYARMTGDRGLAGVRLGYRLATEGAGSTPSAFDLWTEPPTTTDEASAGVQIQKRF